MITDIMRIEFLKRMWDIRRDDKARMELPIEEIQKMVWSGVVSDFEFIQTQKF